MPCHSGSSGFSARIRSSSARASSGALVSMRAVVLGVSRWSRSPTTARSASYGLGVAAQSSAPPAAPAGRVTPSRTPTSRPGTAGGRRTPGAGWPRPGSRRGAGRAAPCVDGVRVRDRLEQRPGVGVPRVGEDLLGVADLDDAAEVHDRDPVAEELRGRQVVGDVDVAEPQLGLEVQHQLQDLGPHRHVEHRDRLVGHEHARSQDDGARHHHPLLLPAGEVARVLGEEQLDRRQADPLQRLDHPRTPLGSRTSPPAPAGRPRPPPRPSWTG